MLLQVDDVGRRHRLLHHGQDRLECPDLTNLSIAATTRMRGFGQRRRAVYRLALVRLEVRCP